jgi:cytochrome c oxidase subunit 2
MGEFPLRPEVASTYAEDVDKLFFVLLALTIVFTVLVGGLLIYLAVRYRRGANVDRSRPVGHNSLLELTWSVGPLILALAVFVWSAKLYTTVYAAPPNAKEIFIIGKQWMWHLQHANGIRENNELHLPVGEPVKLTMISQDVIHAFFVPEFRLQRHVEPGHYSTLWFTPTKPGKYHMYCNMYCGTQHSEMGGWVYVLSKADYTKWAASGGSKPIAQGGIDTPTGGLTMAQQGAALYQQYQCVSCHSPDAVKRGRGPSLVGIYLKNRQLENKAVVRADDGYLRNVIYYPNEYVLAGWPQGMPSYKGVLTEDQVLQINAYIKTLSAGVPGGPAAPPANAAKASATPTQTPQGNKATDTEGGSPNPDAPAANTDNQQWRYMYGGEQYK